jgi:AcrR family transcriptional regulator
MQRNLSKEDWIQFANQWVVHKGFDQLSIDALCKELQVTKGSFYHHFKNRKDLELSIISDWEKKNTDRIIEQVEKSQGSGLKKLFLMTKNLNSREEIAFRVWGETNSKVGESVRKIDKIRLLFLRKLLCLNGKSTQVAEKLSKKIYMIYLGSQLMQPKVSAKELNGIYKDIWDS